MFLKQIDTSAKIVLTAFALVYVIALLIFVIENNLASKEAELANTEQNYSPEYSRENNKTNTEAEDLNRQSSQINNKDTEPINSVAQFREQIFNLYGFSETAKNYISNNSYIIVRNLNDSCGGGGWRPWDRTVELNCAQHEAAVHELSHVWWHNYRLNNPGMAKGLATDLVRLADGEGSETAVEFAKGYVYGIGDWQGMYCTDHGCANVHNIKDSDFDITEEAARARINDWEIYAGLSSWTMGEFKQGSHALPEFLWKYFEPQFTGTIKTTPYYEGGHQ